MYHLFYSSYYILDIPKYIFILVKSNFYKRPGSLNEIGSFALNPNTKKHQNTKDWLGEVSFLKGVSMAEKPSRIFLEELSKAIKCIWKFCLFSTYQKDQIFVLI